MATFAQIRAERKRELQQVRRRQRSLDSEIEKMERTLFRLLDRKTVLETKDAVRLADHYTKLVAEMRALEQSLVDFDLVVIG